MPGISALARFSRMVHIKSVNISALVLIALLSPSFAQENSGVTPGGERIRSENGAPESSPSELALRKQYYEAVKRYNAEILRSGSTVTEEAKALRKEIGRLKGLSDELLAGKKLQEAPPSAKDAEKGESAAAVGADSQSGRRAGRPHLLRETLLVAAALGGLALCAYGVGWGGKPISFDLKTRGTAIIKCPGCGKKLRVPKKRTRVTVRCPECGKRCAYTPRSAGKSG